MPAILTQSLVPKRWRVLSGSALKLIATVLMLIDHVNTHLLAHYASMWTVLFTVGSKDITPVFLLNALGRTAFPLYCFLLVEGFHHTHDVRHYATNLLVFALVSEIPWNLEHGGSILFPESQNVFFTLFLGLIALIALDRWKTAKERYGLELVQLALTAIALWYVSKLLHSDYGIRGVVLVAILYLLTELPLLRAAAGCSVLRSKLLSLPAFVLMGMYNGERGFIRGGLLKYGFYAFYPVHILVIALIKMHLGFV